MAASVRGVAAVRCRASPLTHPHHAPHGTGRLVRLLDSALASKVAAEAQAQAAHSAAEAQGEAIRELEAAAGLQRRREGAMQRAEEEAERAMQRAEEGVGRRSQHAAVEAAAAGREATAALDALNEARRSRFPAASFGCGRRVVL